ERRRPGTHVVRHDEAAHQQPVHEDRAHVAQGDRFAGITGDQAADRDAAEGIHAREDCIEDLAADVLEVAIDTIRRSRFQVLVQAPGLVVDAGVEAVLLGDDPAFLGAPRDADDPAALALGELPNDRADRSGRRRYHDGLARLGLDDPVEPVPGGDPRHADRAQPGRRRHPAGVDPAQVAAVRERVLLPAAGTDDHLPDCELGIARCNDFANGPAAHDLVERLRYRIRLRIVHAPAHVRIERHEVVPDQHLPFARLTDRRLDQLEIGLGGYTLGPRSQQPLLVHVAHFVSLLNLGYLKVPLALAANRPSPS